MKEYLNRVKKESVCDLKMWFFFKKVYIDIEMYIINCIGFEWILFYLVNLFYCNVVVYWLFFGIVFVKVVWL